MKTKKEEAKIEVIGLHNLRAARGMHKKRKLLGRGSGSGHGHTSTRGNKGQTSRTGHSFYAGFEGWQMPLIRKTPKRGFNRRRPRKTQIVNLKDLNKIKDSLINPEVLKNNRLIKDKRLPVKILGDGAINRSITAQGMLLSKPAIKKIEQAGGKVTPS